VSGPLALARKLVSLPHFRRMPRMHLTNLDDPATVGCLEHGLLPEAYPGDRLTLLFDDHPTLGGWYVAADRGPDGWCCVRAGCFPTKVEALVAALEAAPREAAS